MKVLRQIEEFQNLDRRKTFCAIGMFDGLHLGHQHVIRQAIQQARRAKGLSIAVTFDRHPAQIIVPEREPALIYPFRKRRKLLEETQIDLLWIIPFDLPFSQTSANDFLELLCERLRPLKMICVGPGFHFGRQRSGNIQLLQNRSTDLGYKLPEINPIRQQGQEVSSTAIRKLIAEGRLEAAGKRLGRKYALCGQVVPGQKIGRGLGFPTANLDVAGIVLPPNGVYPALAKVKNRTFQGVANIGCRPTVKEIGEPPLAEVHFFDFNQDIYGEHLEVQLLKRIRPEQKFPSRELLRDQIKKDTEAAAQILSKAVRNKTAVLATLRRKILNSEPDSFVT